MPITNINPDAKIVPAPTKDKAKKIGKNAIEQTKTAEEAARWINQSGYGAQGYRARTLDNFDTNHPIYKTNGDWAGQHPGDGKWLEVRDKAEGQPKATTPK